MRSMLYEWSGKEAKRSRLKPLAGFRPQQLAVTIYAAPVAIDKPHWIPAHGAVGRRSLVFDREFREFTTFVLVHKKAVLSSTRGVSF